MTRKTMEDKINEIHNCVVGTITTPGLSEKVRNNTRFIKWAFVSLGFLTGSVIGSIIKKLF